MNERRLTPGVPYVDLPTPVNTATSRAGVAASPGSRPSRFVPLAIALLTVWVVAGAAVATRRLTSSPAPAKQTLTTASSHAGQLHKPGQDVATSFGVFAVEIVDKTTGITSRALGGATHFPSYTPATQMLVKATLNITNRLATGTDFNADQVTLRSGKARLTPVRVSIPDVHLQPDASVDEIVTFVIPREGQRLTLEFSETDGSTVHKVDLGRATAVNKKPDAAPVPEPATDHTHS